MDGRDRLNWVQKNCERYAHVHAVGRLTRRLVEDVAMVEDAEASELASALAPAVDGQFRRHCRIRGIRGGVLVVNVDQVGLVCPMRLRWSRCLGRFLSGERRWCSVRQVRFELGNVGKCVVEAQSVAI